MARPVTVRKSYTADRSRLVRLELAVEKDPKLSSEQKSNVTEKIRSLIQAFMELDGDLGIANGAEDHGKSKSRRGVAA